MPRAQTRARARGNNERSARPKKTPKGAQSPTRSSSSARRLTRRSSAATSSSSSSSTTKDALDCACEDGANGGDWVSVATGEAFDDVSESGSDYKDGLIEPQDEAELVEMNEARQLYLLRYGAIDRCMSTGRRV